MRGDFQQYFERPRGHALPAAARGGADLPERPTRGSRCRSCACATCWCSRSPARMTSPCDRSPVAGREAGGRGAAPGGGQAEGRPVVGAGQAERRPGQRRPGRVPGLVRPGHDGAAVRARVREGRQRPAHRRDQPAWSDSEFGYHVIQVDRAARQRCWIRPISSPPSCRKIPTRSPTWRRPRARTSAAPRPAGSWAGSSTTRYDGRQGRGDLRNDRARRDLGPGGDRRRHLHLQAARTRPTSGSCRSISATRWRPAASTAGWTRCAIRPASGSIRSSTATSAGGAG